MATASALSRVSKKEIIEQAPQIASNAAHQIASSWMTIAKCEDALSMLDTGVVAWRAVPAVQNAMAAIMGDILSANDVVMSVGMQAYPWAVAAGTEAAEVLSVQLGKSLPTNIYACTADDVVATMAARKKGMTVVSMHVESLVGWNDVRNILAASVKADAAVLILISAAEAAPKGVTIDTASDWVQAASMIRDAATQVREAGAIRLIAVDDMDAASMEIAMMEAAGMTPDNWDEAVEKNRNDAARIVNAAYQAPVTSF